MWKKFFTSSVGRKFIMALTGLFLIVFLVVHAYINANVLFDNAEERFNRAAHFMGSNILIRIMEIGLFAGFILHIVQGFALEAFNRSRRQVKYAVNPGNATSKWYSRSMGLLGTLILLFLILHLYHFWVPSRFGGLSEANYGGVEMHNLYEQMQVVFTELWVVIVYVLGCISLGWHLLHGFQSAFQTLGINDKRYTPLIRSLGTGFSIIIPLIFALMPICMHFGLYLDIHALTLFF